jgi:two-component system response regulator MprA
MGAHLHRPDSSGDPSLRYEDLVLDTRRHLVRRGDRPVELTPTEFRLLELFLRNPNRVLTRTEIVMNVWSYDFGPKSNVLNVYIGYLRRKLEADGESRVIQTVRGVGYALRDP